MKPFVAVFVGGPLDGQRRTIHEGTSLEVAAGDPPALTIGEAGAIPPGRVRVVYVVDEMVQERKTGQRFAIMVPQGMARRGKPLDPSSN